MTPAEQKLWEKAARLSYRETEKINEGRFDDLLHQTFNATYKTTCT